MGYELPTIKEGWAMLPRPCKVALGWVAVLAATMAVLTQYAKPLVEQWKELREVEESPFELAQRKKDRDRAGDPYEVKHEDEDTRILLFDSPKDVLTVQWWEGEKSRIWKIHPETYGTAPQLDLTYGQGTPVGAGPMAGGCAPRSNCLPPARHPGSYRPVSEARLDACWFDRRLKWFNNAGWADACVLAIPYNACSNSYAWQQSKWVCCAYH